MIKKLADRGLWRTASVYYGVVGWFLFLVSWLVFEEAVSLGFGCGLLAFGLAFLGLEMILRRMLLAGEVRRGIVQSMGWVGIKFLGPILVLYLGLTAGYSVMASFVGMSCGVLTVALILFFRPDSQ